MQMLEKSPIALSIELCDDPHLSVAQREEFSMPTMKPILYAVSAALAAVLITTTSALAGSGVGGVFNLGQVNTVDAQSTLSGNPGGSPELKVVSTGSAAAISAETNSTDPNGAAVVGKNTGGGAGLKAIVNAGTPPLVVNSSVRVLNLNADLLDGLDSTGFWKLGGNAGTTPGVDFLGTTDNKALELKVKGQRVLRLEPPARPNATSPNLIGGFSANAVVAGAVGATIAGGGSGAYGANLVSDDYGTVGGGIDNVAGDQDAGGDPTSAGVATVGGGNGNTANGFLSFVGGGYGNTASGPESTVAGGSLNTASGPVGPGLGSTIGGGYQNTASDRNSTVAGGSRNTASGNSSTVAGGSANTASGLQSTVGGGSANTASGPQSTVAGGVGNRASGARSSAAGGEFNIASGDFSFAAGTAAWATQNGSFVWGDDSNFASITSPAANTFTVRASGGIWLGTTSTPAITAGHFIDTSTGAYLSSAGAWTDNSSRLLKHNFRPLDKQAVLDKVARLAIQSWSYKAEKPSVRHIGPTAQDFYSAFGLGLDSKHITTIDEGGVALAAIQGLYRQNKVLQRQNKTLRSQLAAQNSRLSRLEHAFSKLSR
jgi:trimeric autotransporter adhesin